MAKFRKKPIVIEAIQYDGENYSELLEFAEDTFCANPYTHTTFIKTLEGIMYFYPGDWIIKGVAGEFYPCKPEIFDQTYEAVE